MALTLTLTFTSASCVRATDLGNWRGFLLHLDPTARTQIHIHVHACTHSLSGQVAQTPVFWRG